MSGSFWSMPSMRDLLGPDMPAFGTPVAPTVPLEPEPLFPEVIGQVLAAASEPLALPGSPWTHTFHRPLPEEALYDCVHCLTCGESPHCGGCDCAAPPAPLLPGYTITRAPEFTGVLGYLEDRL